MIGIGVCVLVPHRVPVWSSNCVRGIDVQIRISQLYALHSGCSAHVVLRGIPRRHDLRERQRQQILYFGDWPPQPEADAVDAVAEAVAVALVVEVAVMAQNRYLAHRC